MAVAGVLFCWIAFATAAAPAPVDVVVTAAPPVDSQRLADAMRAYLDEYGIHVESAAAAEPGELRRQLADAHRLGEAVRAMAVVRAQGGARGMVEIELVDLATNKVLITEIPRPPRDEDLYRALALKIQATLRVTLSEAPERLDPRSGLVRLATAPVPGGEGESLSTSTTPAVTARPARVSLESGYLLFAFPFAGVATQLSGLSLSAAFAPRPWLELTLGTAVLSSLRAEGAGVVAVGTVVPLIAAARVRVASARRFEAMAGPVAEAVYVGIAPSSATVAVQATRDVVPALGLEVEGRFRAGASAWLYGRVAALGVLVGERYRAEGQLLIDTSGAQMSASAGLGIGLP